MTAIEFITNHWDEAILIFMAALGLFSAIARITPNQSDNAIADWIWKRLNNLGLKGPTPPSL